MNQLPESTLHIPQALGKRIDKQVSPSTSNGLQSAKGTD